MSDTVEYGCRWTSSSGETCIGRGDSPDPADSLEFIDSMRRVQRQQGRIADAHLVARTLDDEGLPLDDWHAVPPPVPLDTGQRTENPDALRDRTGL